VFYYCANADGHLLTTYGTTIYESMTVFSKACINTSAKKAK